MTPFEKAVRAMTMTAPTWDDPTNAAKLTAALSALEAEGWVMVPEGPNQKMCENGKERAWSLGHEMMALQCGLVYRAMLAARPSLTPQDLRGPDHPARDEER